MSSGNFFRWIVFFGILGIYGCTIFSPLPPSPEQRETSVSELTSKIHEITVADLLRENSQCLGKGNLSAQGSLNANLKFQFEVYHDSAFIQFKDILGRRSVFMQFLPDKITAWDMLRDRHFSKAEILTQLPFLHVVNSEDLILMLWGGVPEKITTDSLMIIPEDVQLKISTENISLTDLTRANLVSTVNYTNGISGDHMVIRFTNRTYIPRSATSDTSKKIVPSIPWD